MTVESLAGRVTRSHPRSACCPDCSARRPLVRSCARLSVTLCSSCFSRWRKRFAQEASDKLGVKVDLDLVSPLQAFDQGGRARAFATMIEGLGNAKATGLTPEAIKAALAFIDEAPQN
jgi:hypothetical protein